MMGEIELFVIQTVCKQNIYVTLYCYMLLMSYPINFVSHPVS